MGLDWVGWVGLGCWRCREGLLEDRLLEVEAGGEPIGLGTAELVLSTASVGSDGPAPGSLALMRVLLLAVLGGGTQTKWPGVDDMGNLGKKNNQLRISQNCSWGEGMVESADKTSGCRVEE